MAGDSPAQLRKGVLGVRKKKGIEHRYFVLYSDRLEYYSVEEDFVKGEGPRGRFPLEEITELDVKEDSFVIKLSAQSFTVTGREESSFNRDCSDWVADIQRLLGEREGAGGDEDNAGEEEVLLEGYLGIKKKKDVQQRYFVLRTGHLNYFSTQEDASSGKEPRASFPVQELQDIEVAEDGFTLRAPPGQLNFIAEEESVREWMEALRKAQVGEEAEVHCVVEGYLNVKKKKGLESRYFVLKEDCLMYFSTKESWDQDGDPRACINHDDINSIKVVEGGFVLSLGDNSITICADNADLQQWLEGFRGVLPGKVEEPEGAEGTTSGHNEQCVTLSMTFENLDYAKLIAQQTIRNSFEAVVRNAVASEAASGISQENIALILSSGSVIARSTIRPPAGVDAATVAAKLDAASSSLSQKAESGVAAIGKIKSVADGPVTVSGVGSAEVIPATQQLHSAEELQRLHGLAHPHELDRKKKGLKNWSKPWNCAGCSASSQDQATVHQCSLKCDFSLC